MVPDKEVAIGLQLARGIHGEDIVVGIPVGGIAEIDLESEVLDPIANIVGVDDVAFQVQKSLI